MGAAVDKIENHKQSEWFLRRLFGDCEGHFLTLWTFPAKKTSYHKTIPEQSVVEKRTAGNQNLFFGLGLCRKSGGVNVRPKKTEVSGITCLWADVDFGQDGHKQTSLPPDMDSAVELVKSMPFAPSIIVCSGGGIHAYWLFNEPWLFDREDEWAEADELSHRWSLVLKERATEKGWHVDSVFDISRVLRVPGTMNMKMEGHPRPCYVLEHNNFRIDRGEVADLLPPIPVAVKEQRKEIASNRPTSAVSGSIILSADAGYPADKFDVLAENEDDFEPLWKRKRRNLKDKTPSGWDMALTCLLVRAGWTDQEIVNTLLHYRRKHNDSLKLDRPDYYLNTIAKSRQFMSRKMAQENVDILTCEQCEGAPPVTEKEKRDKAIEALSKSLGIAIKGIDKYKQDPPVYHLRLENSNITLGGIASLTSQTQFKNAVAAACGALIPSLSKRVWEKHVQLLLDCCNEIDLGEDSTRFGALETHLRDYLRQKTISMDHDAGCNAKTPFQFDVPNRGESICIHLSSFMQFLKINMLMPDTRNQISVYLRMLGAEPGQVKYYTPKSVRTTANIWRLPNTLFEEFLREREKQ